MATEYATRTGNVTSTETSVINNSSTIATATDDGWFSLHLDLNDMTHGDELRVRVYEKCTSSATQRLLDQWVFIGPQDQKEWDSPAFMLMHGHDWTLTTIAGTTISVPTSLRRVGTSLTEAYSGSSSITSTEWSVTNNSSTLASQTTAGTYCMYFDLSDMVDGDKLRIRVYEKVTSGGTQRFRDVIRTGPQTRPLLALPARKLIHGWEASLTALAGTITVPRSIRKV